MKKIGKTTAATHLWSLLLLLVLTPSVSVSAQDNTWERGDDLEEPEVEEAKRVNPDAKYLRGAVPTEDGKVIFRQHIDAPGKSQAEVFAIARKYMMRMTREKNQLGHSQVIDQDSTAGTLTGAYEEWLVFKATAISLDRTRLSYALQVVCRDGSMDISLGHIRYVYDEERDKQRYKAEKWITDEVAVNKRNTKLLPITAKFRRKTIDRKDFLFNKFETLLQ